MSSAFSRMTLLAGLMLASACYRVVSSRSDAGPTVDAATPLDADVADGTRDADSTVADDGSAIPDASLADAGDGSNSGLEDASLADAGSDDAGAPRPTHPLCDSDLVDGNNASLYVDADRTVLLVTDPKARSIYQATATGFSRILRGATNTYALASAPGASLREYGGNCIRVIANGQSTCEGAIAAQSVLVVGPALAFASGSLIYKYDGTQWRQFADGLPSPYEIWSDGTVLYGTIANALVRIPLSDPSAFSVGANPPGVILGHLTGIAPDDIWMSHAGKVFHRLPSQEWQDVWTVTCGDDVRLATVDGHVVFFGPHVVGVADASGARELAVRDCASTNEYRSAAGTSIDSLLVASVDSASTDPCSRVTVEIRSSGRFVPY